MRHEVTMIDAGIDSTSRSSTIFNLFNSLHRRYCTETRVKFVRLLMYGCLAAAWLIEIVKLRG